MMKRFVPLLILLIPLLGFGLIFAYMFRNAPVELATDWIDHIYPGIEGGRLTYEPIRGPHHPPWSMLFVLPLGLLPPAPSWGILIYAYLVVLFFSVPMQRPRWRSGLAIMMLLFSFIVIRAALDGNLEIMATGGILLLLSGYQRKSPALVILGGLLATAKPQLSTLFIIVMGIYMLRTWPRRQWLYVLLIGGGIVAATFLWMGQEWIRGTDTGHSGWLGFNAMVQSGVPVWVAIPLVGLVFILTVAICWRGQTFTREKAGILIAAMLLITPYASSVSLVSVMAIGIIPLFIRRPWIGLIPILVLNIPTVVRLSAGGLQDPPDIFWNGSLLFCWAILLFFVWQQEKDLFRVSTGNADLRTHP